VNHPPNSDVEMTFNNSHHEDPISIVVRMRPFSHGRAFAAASKTITIRVDPYNPYPKGIPTSTGNITIRYAGSPQDSYEQGSSLIVNWTDTLSRDPCVNLLLAKDGSNGLQYIGRVSQELSAARGCRNLYLDNSCEVLGKRLSGLCCCAGTAV
jgi:hypothetical protein